MVITKAARSQSERIKNIEKWRWRGRRLGGALVLALAFSSPSSVARAQGSAPTSPSSASIPSPLDYRVSPEDVLDIYVFEVPEISRTYRVSPTGSISLPLISEPIPAAGLSPSQLSQAVAAKFRDGGLLTNPQVTISVRETRLHSVVVGGAVKKPVVFPVFGPTKLVEVISQAEGLAEDAGNLVVITRAGATGHGTAGSLNETVDVRRLLETGDESLNVELYPGDRVTVQRAGIIYVIGAVNRPGGYPLKDSQEEMTVLKALALAGDVTSSAKRNQLVILHKDQQSQAGRQEVPLDLKKIIAGRSPDPHLRADDIVFVPENGKLKAVHQALGTGIGMGTAITTGVIVYRR